jgi:hypothetical protein
VFCPTGQIGRHRGPNHGYRPLLDGTQTDVERTSAMGHTRELGDASCLLDGGRQLANLRLCGRPEVGMKQTSPQSGRESSAVAWFFVTLPPPYSKSGRFDGILSAIYIAFVIRELNMVLGASHFWRFYEIHCRYHCRCAGSSHHTCACRECDAEPRVAREAEGLQEGGFCAGAPSVEEEGVCQRMHG